MPARVKRKPKAVCKPEIEVRFEPTPYGFRWGPVEVERLATLRGFVYLGINTAIGRIGVLRISPTGRKVVWVPQEFRPRGTRGEKK